MEYKANFFLFATLDNARHIQHGRIPQQPAALPVLTGTPVAGMAHLERPHPAGYFIFPDLSVRHEGKYRLGFSLYEELKEVEDMDPEVADNPDKHKNPHVSHRLEVKSAPFTVFSAKRFPGLAESTSLSKVFAEQGCRVRIRRDVRMRRRGADKPQDYDEEEYDAKARVSTTPERITQKPMGTPHQTPEHNDNRPTSRRPSNEHIGYASHSPTSPQAPYPPAWSSAYAPPPPPTHYSPQPYAGHSPSMAPPSFSPYSHTRNSSMDYSHPPAGPPRHSHAPTYPTPYATAPTASHPPAPIEAPLHSPTSYSPIKQERSLSYPTIYAPPPPQPSGSSVIGSKRSYGSTFDTSSMEKPLRHGERPTPLSVDPHYAVNGSNGFDVEEPEPWKAGSMSYRRADGTKVRRNFPVHIAA
jgi:hypothetical protein